MDGTKLVILLLLLLILLVFSIWYGPIFTIWSLNLLFGLQIPVTFKTWCAVLWLLTVLNGIRIKSMKD